MANGSFPKQGRANILKLLGGVGGANYTVHLYKSSSTINDNTTIGTIQEANYSGYAPLSLSGWSDPAATGSGDEQQFGPLFLFTHNGGITANDIGGYYVTVTVSAVTYYLWHNPLDAVKTMAGGTDQIAVRPVVGARAIAP